MSLIAYIQHESPANLHLLVLIILKPELIRVFLQSRDFSTVECSSFRVTGKNLLANHIVWERRIRRRYRYQCSSRGLIDLARGAVLVRLGVLDFVPECCE